MGPPRRIARPREIWDPPVFLEDKWQLLKRSTGHYVQRFKSWSMDSELFYPEDEWYYDDWSSPSYAPFSPIPNVYPPMMGGPPPMGPPQNLRRGFVPPHPFDKGIPSNNQLIERPSRNIAAQMGPFHSAAAPKNTYPTASARRSSAPEAPKPGLVPPPVTQKSPPSNPKPAEKPAPQLQPKPAEKLAEPMKLELKIIPEKPLIMKTPSSGSLSPKNAAPSAPAQAPKVVPLGAPPKSPLIPHSAHFDSQLPSIIKLETSIPILASQLQQTLQKLKDSGAPPPVAQGLEEFISSKTDPILVSSGARNFLTKILNWIGKLYHVKEDRDALTHLKSQFIHSLNYSKPEKDWGSKWVHYMLTLRGLANIGL